MRHSEENITLNKKSEAARFEQQVTKQPLIYISQHSLKPNAYHVWDPYVWTIEVPIGKVFELACRIDALLASSAKVAKQEKDERVKEKLGKNSLNLVYVFPGAFPSA